MLRRTAAKAFGTGEGTRETVSPATRETCRDDSVKRLFQDLHQGILNLANGLRVSSPRPLPRGIEFILEGPGACIRFLDAQEGYIQVHEGKSGSSPEEILSVQLQAGHFTPIRKASRLDDREGQARRVPFRFTSIPDLAGEYVARAEGPGVKRTGPPAP